MADNKIIERLQKMMRLAQNDGATEGEVKAALAMARKLMDQYNISEHEVLLSDEPSSADTFRATVTHEDVYSRANAVDRWDVSLACAAAKLFDCEVLLWSSYGVNKRGVRGQMQSVRFVGSKHDIDCASSLFKELLVTMRAMARCRFPQRQWPSYWKGFANMVYNRVCDERAVGQAGAIVLRKSSIVNEWMTTAFGPLGEAKLAKRTSKIDWNAYSAGQKDGQSVSLTQKLDAPARKELK